VAFVGETFVFIGTGLAVALVAHCAGTFVAKLFICTERIGMAWCVQAFIHFITGQPVASQALLTGARATTLRVITNSIGMAVPIISYTFIDIFATFCQGSTIASEACLARAGVRAHLVCAICIDVAVLARDRAFIQVLAMGSISNVAICAGACEAALCV
jgi:hypothetical protein